MFKKISHDVSQRCDIFIIACDIAVGNNPDAQYYTIYAISKPALSSMGLPMQPHWHLMAGLGVARDSPEATLTR